MGRVESWLAPAIPHQTALMTVTQVQDVVAPLDSDGTSYVSVFAGCIADKGA